MRPLTAIVIGSTLTTAACGLRLPDAQAGTRYYRDLAWSFAQLSRYRFEAPDTSLIQGALLLQQAAQNVSGRMAEWEDDNDPRRRRYLIRLKQILPKYQVAAESLLAFAKSGKRDDAFTVVRLKLTDARKDVFALGVALAQDDPPFVPPSDRSAIAAYITSLIPDSLDRGAQPKPTQIPEELWALRAMRAAVLDPTGRLLQSDSM